MHTIVIVAGVLGGIAMIAVMVGAWLVRARTPQAPSPPTTPWTTANPLWTIMPNSVAPASLVGDPTEDVAAVVGVVPYDGRPHFHLAVFDGKTFQRSWVAEQNAGLMPDRAIVALGTKIVFAEENQRVRIHDSATGRSLLTVNIPPNTVQLCVPSGSQRHVWVESFMKTNVRIDIDTGATTAEPKPPPGCVSRSDADRGRENAVRRDVDIDNQRFRAMLDGDLGVGVSALPSPENEIVGFVPSTKKVLWRTTAASVSASLVELHGEQVFVKHTQETEDDTLDCLDARTGARIWSRTFTGTRVNGVAFGANRLYVDLGSPHEHRIEVLDRASLRVLGAFRQ